MPEAKSDGPRKANHEDKRPFTPIANEAIRWTLGPRYDCIRVTYIFLVSWTTDRSNLVYHAAKYLAIERGISLKAFYRHLAMLQDLKLVTLLPRQDVAGTGRRDEHAIYVTSLPSWVQEINELIRRLKDVPKGRRYQEQLEKTKKDLKMKQEEITSEIGQYA